MKQLAACPRPEVVRTLVDEFMRSSQHRHYQVDRLLDSKCIRGGGKSGDGESKLRMPVHLEMHGKPESPLDEVFQLGLGDLGLLGVCQLSLLPEPGSTSCGNGLGKSQDQTANRHRPEASS